jgi:hypothetical protein
MKLSPKHGILRLNLKYPTGHGMTNWDGVDNKYNHLGPILVSEQIRTE